MHDPRLVVMFYGSVMTPALVLWLTLNGWIPSNPGMVLYLAAVVFTSVVIDGGTTW